MSDYPGGSHGPPARSASPALSSVRPPAATYTNHNAHEISSAALVVETTAQEHRDACTCCDSPAGDAPPAQHITVPLLNRNCTLAGHHKKQTPHGRYPRQATCATTTHGCVPPQQGLSALWFARLPVACCCWLVIMVLALHHPRELCNLLFVCDWPQGVTAALVMLSHMWCIPVGPFVPCFALNLILLVLGVCFVCLLVIALNCCLLCRAPLLPLTYPSSPV